jgi:DNA-binding NtrC family response regulator
VTTVLVVDDEEKIRTHLATYLRGQGHQVLVAANAPAALRLADTESLDLVLSDVRMAGMDGMALLRELRRRRPDAVVVLMTAFATIAGAVEAMREGAFHYLVKPFALDEVGLLVQQALELGALRRDNRELRRALDAPALLDSRSAAMHSVLETARRVATSDATVLLLGESGTGKNVLARALHGWSARRNGPLVTVSCTTLAEHLLESELFGHVKGAFTGAWKDKPGRLEAAAGGTVFLDEVGELPGELQAKLLRFLEERRFERVGGGGTLEVDARIVAATNRDLEQEVRAGRFRADLYYRLAVVALRLPPLRERREDLLPLIEHLLTTLAARHRRRRPRLEPEARDALLANDWPGNVRELANVLQVAAAMTEGHVIGATELAAALGSSHLSRRSDDGVGPNGTQASETSGKAAVRETTLSALRARHRAELRELVGRALTGADGNKRKAARSLGVSRQGLYRVLDT